MHDFFVFDYNQKLQESRLQDVATQSGVVRHSSLSNDLLVAACFIFVHGDDWLHLSRGQVRRVKTHLNT